MISLAAAVQSPYLYLLGISVLTCREWGVGMFKQWAASGVPFPSSLPKYTSRLVDSTFEDILTLCM